MKATCKAIVLRQFSYSETSIIISCFTKEHGIKSFLYKGGKKKKNAAVLLPLKIVEINYYQHTIDSLASINSIHTATALNNLYQNPIKTSLVFFMGEFLNQLLHKIQYAEAHLFEEIQQELIWLNESEEVTNYPIFWMIKWIDYLGLKPTLGEGNYFDIEMAQFTKHQTNSLLFHYGETIGKLAQLFTLNHLEILSYSLHKTERTKIIEALIDYYKFHVPEFKNFKSVDVLQTVLN